MTSPKGCWDIFLFKTKILKMIKIFIPHQDSKMVIVDTLGLATSSLWGRHICGAMAMCDVLLWLSAARAERRKEKVSGTAAEG